MPEKEKHQKEGKTEEKFDILPAHEEKNEPAIDLKEGFGKIPKHNWAIFTYIFAIISVILLVMLLTGRGLTGNVINENQAGEKIVGFVNSRTGGDAKLISSKDMGPMYSVLISYQNDEIPLYITKDGKYLVQGVVPLETESQKEEVETAPKSDKPKVELYVMSFCPYGNRAEDTMLPVYNLLKDKVEWSIHYIVSVQDTTVNSLHGPPEVEQDEREACVLSEYGLDKWWKFTTKVNSDCGQDGSCWLVAAEIAGLDVNRIKACMSQKGLDLMKADEAAANAADASGSPTMIINGVGSSAVYQYGNSEAYKKAICDAFNTAPSECSTELSSSSDSGAAGGSC